MTAAFAAARAFLGAVPRWVYIALAVAALIGGGVFLHSRAVSTFGNERYQAGVAHEAARVEAKARALEQRVNELTAKIRSTNDETNRRIADDADALRLRGPGKAACPPAGAAAPGGRLAPPGAADAPMDQVPDPERVDLIALPFADAIAFAEQHDRLRAEALSWREQNAAIRAATPKQ